MISPVYFPLLLLNMLGPIYGIYSFLVAIPYFLPLTSPGLVLNLANHFLFLHPLQDVKMPMINFAFFLFIGPWLFGIAIYYTHQYLNQQKVSLYQASQQVSTRIGSLLLASVALHLVAVLGFLSLYFEFRILQQFNHSILFLLLGILVCSIPVLACLFLTICTGFTLYFIELDDCSVWEAVKRSWRVFENRFQAVIWAIACGSLIPLIPIKLISLLMGVITKQEEDRVSAQLIGIILWFLISPLLNVYSVLLYMRLRTPATLSQSDIGTPA